MARVVTVAGKRCRIDLIDGPRVEAVVRGRLFDTDRTNAIVVGDEVMAREQGGAWSVDSILRRRNAFVRQGLRKERQVLFANVDRVLILASLAEPQTKAAAIDRFLVAALQGEIPPALVLTKRDLDEGGAREHELRTLYESFGLPLYPVSNRTGAGIADVAEAVSKGTTAVVGNSGVGKSSLLNTLVPDLDLVVRDVSVWSGKGTHTTTAALMVTVRNSATQTRPYRPVDGGGPECRLIDTPGMKSFVPYGITKENLAELFPEIVALAPECRFSDCRHLVEPGCAVLLAVENGRMAESRWRSYQRMHDEIEDLY